MHLVLTLGQRYESTQVEALMRVRSEEPDAILLAL